MIRCIEGRSHFVTSKTAPTASGWSIFAGWDLHPPEGGAFHGAHPFRSVVTGHFRVSRSTVNRTSTTVGDASYRFLPANRVSTFP